MSNKKQEALIRLTQLGAAESIISAYALGLIPFFYDCGDEKKMTAYDKELNKFIDGTEIEYDMKEELAGCDECEQEVFYIDYKAHSEFGPMLSMYYVSKYEDEWKYDHEDIEYQQHIAKVKSYATYDGYDIGACGLAKNKYGLLYRDR